MFCLKLCSICVLILLAFPIIVINGFTNEETEDGITDIAKEPDDRLLLFSLIDGSLIAVEQQTGNIKWQTKDQPTVKVPVDTREAIVPLFLPDPKDGSLYLLGGKTNQNLKKLPFTIPQLVASSPCRSTDGILYTGKKKDTWFMMDPDTGIRQKILGFERSAPTCPITSAKAVYVGRTQYTIMMIDSKMKDRHWNVTFYDYTASPMNKEMMNDYDLVHFAASSSGRIVTLDRRIGRLLWEKDFGSPVVAVYILDPEGFLSAPFSSLAHDTLKHLADHFSTYAYPFTSQLAQMQLYPTLYIGEHHHGLYALPSLVDQNVVTISASNSGPLLLEGPDAIFNPSKYRVIPMPGMNVRIDPDNDPQMFQTVRDKFHHLILLGYYNVPEYSLTRLQINGRVAELIPDGFLIENSSAEKTDDKQIVKPMNLLSVGVQTDSRITEDNSTSLKKLITKTQIWMNQQENKGLKIILIILVGCVIAMFWYVRAQMREFQQLSQSGSRNSQHSSSGRYGPVTAVAEDLPNGMMRIGKIMFAPDQLLGKGCDGTFVYRGKFDNRDVAVKRVLPACFTFADREVNLLRESDEHAHVIRYFCMEQDRQFRYIALELCAATVQDYVQGRYDKSLISPLDILLQATNGLAHLHSLDIVHRDIKPPNVLLSMPNARNEVRAMISDFGLSKKLQVGRLSFSRRSGITGTEGWIAPEMLNGHERTTTAVDMFSLGCLFYYVLSDGRHPFGEPLRRQANIISGEYRLSDLKGDKAQIELARMLISKLINGEAPRRPAVNTVLIYPLFWNQAKILGFYQDVSDRIEKIELEDSVLLSLEKNGLPVVRGDWRRHIDPEVAQDLRKYRSYRGESVRDLMRALRNKKHHYRELSQEAQHSLGDIPDGFTCYWNNHFPLLLLHSWLAMQCCKNETTFCQYYHSNFQFPEQNYLESCDYKTQTDFFDDNELLEKNFGDNLQNTFDNPDPNNFWMKKKPKYDYRNTSPRKFNVNKNNSRFISDESERENVFPGKRNYYNANRAKKHKHNGKPTGDEPAVWAVPQENKKLQ